MRRDPREFGQQGTRWTLDRLRSVCVLIGHYTRSGMWRVLDGLGVRWKHARDHVRSPDPDYLAKLEGVALAQALVRASVAPGGSGSRGERVLLYQDEFTYYRQPAGGFGWAATGSKEPLAERAYRANTRTRVTAALDAQTGRVTALQAPRIGGRELVRFYERLGAAYPAADRLYVVQDNWPLHTHPDVLAALMPQEAPWATWPRPHPPNWPTAPSPAARRLDLPIQLVPLPTYASWTNPIEKLWRWLKDECLRFHRAADDLAALRQEVLAFLARFAHGSDALLRYVGLLPD